MSFTDELFKVVLLLLKTCPVIYAFASSASCHDAERISSKFTDSWMPQSVASPPLENIATPLYRPVARL